MKKYLLTSLLMTFWTTVLLGLIYPLLVTGAARVLFPDQARGQLILRDGTTIGSRIIGQPFTGPEYFHPRPSAAGSAGYDATSSQGTNLGPTNRKLIDRVNSDVARLRSENAGASVPADLVTSSASGLDPDISPAAAEFQVSRIARVRHLPEDQLRRLIHEHIQPRQFRVLGEPRVNVLELNLALEEAPKRFQANLK
jgi:potassium-transporting ATPase KdpC subunit